jgi:hypothetical protein
MAYKHILYEENKKDCIGILTLNEPEKRNALGREAEEEITHVVQDAGKREALKVLILRAAGDIFCAGHNRQEILNQPASAIRLSRCPVLHYCRGARDCHGWRLPSGSRLRSDYSRQGEGKIRNDRTHLLLQLLNSDHRGEQGCSTEEVF